MSDALKDKLIDAGKILALEGHGDHVLGHLTVRTEEDSNLILMKPSSIGIEEITRDNITVVDIEGRKVSGPLPRHTEVFIHTEIMRVRPEIRAVVHTHPKYAIAFSSLDKPMQPVGHDGTVFIDGLPVFDETTDLIVDQDRGKAVTRCLGGHRAMLLRNHGIVTCGESLEEAVYLALTLERACSIQLLAEAAGGPRLVSNAEDARAKKRRQINEGLIKNTFDYLRRRITNT